MPEDLVGRFEREGWLLTRSYNDEIGATVAEAFGTDDRSAVESYCRANAIEFEWQSDGGLRPGSVERRGAASGHRPALLVQPDRVPQRVDDRRRSARVPGRQYGEDGLPFNTCFGNGDPIGEDVIELLNQIYVANTVREPWQAGDLMLVDNIHTAHAGRPTSGRARSWLGWLNRYASGVAR